MWYKEKEYFNVNKWVGVFNRDYSDKGIKVNAHDLHQLFGYYKIPKLISKSGKITYYPVKLVNQVRTMKEDFMYVLINIVNYGVSNGEEYYNPYKEQVVAEQSLGQAELDAYRMLGQQQLELENTIAEQRKKALVSGTTSAQLAAGQLQNMFAAQSGAAQVAQSLANQRTQMNQTFAEKRTGVETSLYDYINQQQTIAATAGAQNLAALSSYASYANKNYNDMMSLYQAKQNMSSSAWKEITDILNKQ